MKLWDWIFGIEVLTSAKYKFTGDCCWGELVDIQVKIRLRANVGVALIDKKMVETCLTVVRSCEV